MFVFEKNNFHLKFDEEKGMIHSFQVGEKEYVGVKVPIFRIALRDAAGDEVHVDYAQMKLIECQKEEDSVWATYEDLCLKVTVMAELRDQIEWKLSICPKGEYLPEWVDFPQIVVPNELRDNLGTSKILWGYCEGGVIDDLAYRESYFFKYLEPEYPIISSVCLFPGIVQTPILAYYDDFSGIYLGAHDKEDHLKFIDFYAFETGIMLQFRHYCGQNRGETFSMPYPVVMKGFSGEWQDAAQIYKNWIQENKADILIPILENKSLPEWYGESPVVIIYPVRGAHDGDKMDPNKLFPYVNGLPHVEKIEKALNSKVMVLLMHWEGTAPWAPPYVWPPYGGAEELKKFTDALHERGDLLGVYCSGIGWTQYSKLVDDYNREKEFEQRNLKDVMCLSPKEELLYCNVVPQIRAGYNMCPSQPFTENVIKEQLQDMCAAEIDYIQIMDQNYGGGPYFCYATNHGHPPVPGKWQVDAMKKIYKTLDVVRSKVLIGSEGAGAEAYLPYLNFSDNRFEYNYGVGRPVPLYAYLYHEYVNNFMGNQVCTDVFLDHKRSRGNLLERIAYAFSAGDMLSITLDENGNIIWSWGWNDPTDIPDQEDVLLFIKNLNAWRYGIGKKYLHTGSMVKPYPVLCNKNVFYGPRGHVFEIENIHTSAWETKDGNWGQFLINYNTEDIECKIDLLKGQYMLYENDMSGYPMVGELQTIKIKKLSAVMIEKC